MNQAWAVSNDAALERFEVRIDEQLAVLKYRIDGSRVTFFHAGVPQNLEGRGIGSAMAHAALEYAKTEHLEVIPLCPFVRVHIEKHPEYRPMVSEDYRGP